MRNDHYQYARGRVYAAEALLALQSLLGAPKFVKEVVERLETRARDAPPHFARGIRDLLAQVRAVNG